jgi:hypothetical protein
MMAMKSNAIVCNIRLRQQRSRFSAHCLTKWTGEVKPSTEHRQDFPMAADHRSRQDPPRLGCTTGHRRSSCQQAS